MNAPIVAWNLVEAVKHENLNFGFKFESLLSWISLICFKKGEEENYFLY